jgi:hypothetical protein
MSCRPNSDWKIVLHQEIQRTGFKAFLFAAEQGVVRFECPEYTYLKPISKEALEDLIVKAYKESKSALHREALAYQRNKQNAGNKKLKSFT